MKWYSVSEEQYEEYERAVDDLSAYRARAEKAEAEAERLDKALDEELGEVERIEDVIAAAARAAGCQEEWSSGHDHCVCLFEHIFRLESERDSLRDRLKSCPYPWCDADKIKAERDAAREELRRMKMENGDMEPPDSAQWTAEIKLPTCPTWEEWKARAEKAEGELYQREAELEHRDRREADMQRAIDEAEADAKFEFDMATGYHCKWLQAESERDAAREELENAKANDYKNIPCRWCQKKGEVQVCLECFEAERTRWANEAKEAREELRRMREWVAIAAHKLSYLVRDYPDDKQSKGLIQEAAALLKGG